jgi:hypothetical protein
VIWLCCLVPEPNTRFQGAKIYIFFSLYNRVMKMRISRVCSPP